MSSQNQGASLCSSADTPTKRKRGRPRKDESVQGDSTPVTPASDILMKNKQSMGTSNTASDEMVGQMVSGVIEGSFDAGYLLHVKVGDTNTHLRGVVFLPGRFTPVTAANDVAPHAKMYERKEISIPFVNPQSQHHAVGPPSGKSEKPVENKNDAPNLPDQSLHTGLQSGGTTASESKSASILIPPASNLQINDTGLPLGQKVLKEQILGSRLQNDKAVVQDQSLEGFEALKLMKGPNIDVEAPKASEPVSATFTSTLPATDTVILKPQVEHQALSLDLKPQELIHDDVKSLDFGNNQTPKFPEPEPQSVACEPTGIKMFEKQASSRQDKDISQDTQPEHAKKIICGNDKSRMDGLSTSDTATTTVTVPCSVSTSLPIMIFGAETIPSESRPGAEESDVPRRVVSEVSSSSMAANTNSVEKRCSLIRLSPNYPEPPANPTGDLANFADQPKLMSAALVKAAKHSLSHGLMSDVTDCYHYFQEFDALVAVLPSSEGGEEAQLRRIAELQAENDAVGQELQKQLEAASTFSHPSGCLLDLLPSIEGIETGAGVVRSSSRYLFELEETRLESLPNGNPPFFLLSLNVFNPKYSKDTGKKSLMELINEVPPIKVEARIVACEGELETLQKQHEEKTLKIQELKRQIVTVKLCLEKKKNIPDARKEAFNDLSEKYSSLREEYNALLAERSREQN
ncbi:hypothetical protein QUC31_013162 [Theobroma cacao]